MKRYFRIMLGAKSIHADACFNNGFIGADFGIHQDLTNHLYENWRDFNKEFIPVWQNKFPGRSKISAGLACGALWTISKGIKAGDMIISPKGDGTYLIGEVLDNYYYKGGDILPHRRNVKWFSSVIDRVNMSDALRNSTGSIGTVSDISKHATELEGYLTGNQAPLVYTNDETIEDFTEFALEKHLEDFLVKNWRYTELGRQYDIYMEDGEIVGQQYPSDTGPIDILAISKDKKSILVVELKKGRVSDHVVGQVQRYMGFVLEQLAEKGQEVKGVIIGFEDDLKIKRALSVTNNIEFYKYQVTFKLFKS